MNETPRNLCNNRNCDNKSRGDINIFIYQLLLIMTEEILLQSNLIAKIKYAQSL